MTVDNSLMHLETVVPKAHEVTQFVGESSATIPQGYDGNSTVRVSGALVEQARAPATPPVRQDNQIRSRLVAAVMHLVQKAI